MKGCVFNVQRYSVHDGPGIRTIVFLKGCPLQCKWCSNPESQLSHPQIGYNIEKCMGEVCMLCGTVCPQQNIQLMDTNKVDINHRNCIHCLACAKICPSKAINVYGEYRKINDILNEVEADGVFYARSDGGLTLSGGEPLLQTDFVLALLKEAKRRRIHTAIETCGHMPWEQVKDIFQYLDYIHFDIKHLDSEKHKHWTGQGNEMILDTFKQMRNAYPEKEVCVRTPIIPGFNDVEEDIRGIRDFVKQFPNTTYEVLPYHRFGTVKYDYIGRAYPLDEEELDDHLFKQLKAISLE